jgi:hypothetical protein
MVGRNGSLRCWERRKTGGADSADGEERKRADAREDEDETRFFFIKQTLIFNYLISALGLFLSTCHTSIYLTGRNGA